MKTQYIGTTFANGQPLNDTCVQGFDTAAFMVGSADAAMNVCTYLSSLFLMLPAYGTSLIVRGCHRVY